MYNTKVLVVDDEEIVRDSIREILVPRKKVDQGLEEASFDLFDEEETIEEEGGNSYHPEFLMDEANNGKTGLEKVKKAVEDGKPYAVIFLDMRMPGWDGLTTCVEIRKIDPKAQVFFVTAFTDRSIEEIILQAGGDVGYLSKPFVQEEILQLATKGVYDWYRLTNLEHLLEIVGQIGFGETQLNTLLVNILQQIANYVGTEYSVLGRFDEEGKFEMVTQMGIGEERLQVARLLEKLDFSKMTKVEFHDGVLICPLEQYCILSIPRNGKIFNQEKIYLLHLFVENAVRAIRNSELSAKLIQREKLSAIGEAISMVMHDIKTPISQIQSLTELIQDDPNDTEEIVDLTNDIFLASENAMDIIYDVRDFVKNANLAKEPIQVSVYLNGIVHELQKSNGTKSVSIEVNAEEDLTGQGDPKKLKRVIVNLVNNAVEAMENHKVDSPKVSISSYGENGFVYLSIQDNGPGIPEKILNKLFDPFVTSGKANGTGLGLAIVKQIVEAHQGEISVDSSESGAKFQISLPTK
ncbi:MAG: hybrid sensor histidine kinase/response regulator [Bacteroidota bacterium]